MPVAVDASKTLLTGIISTTWANRPSSAGNGQMYLFTDIGSSGTLMRYANSRWRPLAGQAQLAQLGAAVTGITNAETIVLQTLIPAAAWQTNDTIRIWLVTTKSGSTDTGQLTIRIGTAGTTADTVLTGFSAYSLMSAGGLSGGGIFDIKLISSTSAQKLGSSSATTSLYPSPTQNSATNAATTITDASANALYISVALKSSSTNDTMGVQSGQIQLITP